MRLVVKWTLPLNNLKNSDIILFVLFFVLGPDHSMCVLTCSQAHDDPTLMPSFPHHYVVAIERTGPMSTS